MNINSKTIACYNDAVAQKEKKNYQQAIALFKKVLKTVPDMPQAIFNLAIVQYETADYSSAKLGFQQFLKIMPSYLPAHINLGHTHSHLGEYTHAIESLKTALKLEPSNVESLQAISDAYLHEEEFDLALQAITKALSLSKENEKLKSHQQAGIIYRRIGQSSKAIDHYTAALKINPKNSDTLCYIGVAYKRLKDFNSSLSYLDQALAENPNHKEAAFHKSLLLLQNKDYENGWPLYESRKSNRNNITDHLSIPKWDRNSKAQSIAIIPEQGLGDHIMFCRLLHDFSAQNPQLSILVFTDARLISLFKDSLPNIQFEDNHSILEKANAQDAYLMMGSIARSIEFPHHTSITPQKLHPNAALITKIQSQLQKTEQQLTIGISWKTNNKKTRRERNIQIDSLLSTFKEFQPLVINLQYGDTKEEEKTAKEMGIPLHSPLDIDNFNDIDGLAAKIANCDLVITVDNSTAHLAGAMAVDTLILLPWVSDWRWGIEPENTPWYSSVKLLRQAKQDDWGHCLDTVRNVMKSYR